MLNSLDDSIKQRSDYPDALSVDPLTDSTTSNLFPSQQLQMRVEGR